VKTTALALSAGDPAGIGPEIIAKAWSALRAEGPSFMVVGDAQLLASAGGGVKVRAVTGPVEAIKVFGQALPVLDIPLQAPVVAGKPSSAYAGQVIRWIETGAGLALSGAVAGLVTAPIAKAPLYDAGFAFPGHTEFLAELTHVGERQPPHGPIMMLAVRDLRATLVTIHTPLSAVPAALSIEAIVNAGLVTAEALRKDFGIAVPRLAVAALKPAPWAARRRRSSSRRCAPCANWASRSGAPPPPTACSTPRPAPPTTRCCACITTRR
jgi:4-hydroxythreonine-4-phosphate dehydrogenase